MKLVDEVFIVRRIVVRLRQLRMAEKFNSFHGLHQRKRWIYYNAIAILGMQLVAL